MKLSDKMQTFVGDMVDYLREERPLTGLAEVFHGISKEKGFWDTISQEEFFAAKMICVLHEKYGENSFRELERFIPDEKQRAWVIEQEFVECNSCQRITKCSTHYLAWIITS